MRAKVYLPLDVLRVVVLIPRCRIDANRATISASVGAKNMPPRMAVRHFDAPSERLGIRYRFLDRFLRVPRPSHALIVFTMLTPVKQDGQQ